MAGDTSSNISNSTVKDGSKHNPSALEKSKPKFMGAKSMGSRYAVLEEIMESVMGSEEEDESVTQGSRFQEKNAMNELMQEGRGKGAQTVDEDEKEKGEFTLIVSHTNLTYSMRTWWR